MTVSRAFLASAAIGIVAVLALAGVSRYRDATTPGKAVAHPLRDAAFVTDQVSLDEIRAFADQGYRTLISLRPDGEATDQPSSATISDAARAAGLAFAYIPTPRGNIPDTAADDLAQTLAKIDRPVVMYCRSGSRAARVWALAEASRPGGPSAEEIAAAVTQAGQSVDGLNDRLNARIAARGTP